MHWPHLSESLESMIFTLVTTPTHWPVFEPNTNRYKCMQSSTVPAPQEQLLHNVGRVSAKTTYNSFAKYFRVKLIILRFTLHQHPGLQDRHILLYKIKSNILDKY